MEDDPNGTTGEEDWRAIGTAALRGTSRRAMGFIRWIFPAWQANQSEFEILASPPHEVPLEIAPRIPETDNPATLQTSETPQSTNVPTQSSKLEAQYRAETPESTYLPTQTCNLKGFDYYDIPPNSSVASGKPIRFLVHPFASSSKIYIKFVNPLLEEGYRMVLLDLPQHEETIRGAGKMNEDKFDWEQNETLRLSAGPSQKCFTFNAEMLSVLALVQKISLEHSSPPVFLAGIGLGRHVVCALLSKFPKLVQGVMVSGMSAGPLNDGDEIIEVHTKEPPKINKVLGDSGATGTDEAASVEVDCFKLTFNPSYLPELRQLQPTLVLIGQKDSGPLHILPTMRAHAPAKSGFHLLAYNINTGTNKTQSMTLENVWHYHSIDYPEPFEEIADWVWKCAKG